MRGTRGGRIRAAGAGVAGAVVLAAAGAAVSGCAASGAQAALPRATCGGAVTHSLSATTRLLSADKGALTCFGNAARRCTAASLAVTEMGTDIGTDYVFTVEPGGKTCQVTELSQGYGVNFGGSAGPVVSTRCRLAGGPGADVALNCAGQDVLIPATVTQP